MSEDLYTKAVAMAAKAAVVSLLNRLVEKDVIKRNDALDILDKAIEELEEIGGDPANSANTILKGMQGRIK
jgi:hypothetical protein